MEPENNLSALSLANLEALASESGGDLDGSESGTAVGDCYTRLWGGSSSNTFFFECNSKTSDSMIYPCPSSETYGTKGVVSKCTK